MCDSFESFDKAITGGGERRSWLSSTDSDEYATAVPSLVGMASLSEVEDFDASTINDLSKVSAGLPMDSSNLSSIAEERNHEQNCTSSSLTPGKLTADSAQRSKQSRLYTARHYSIGNVEKIYGLRKGSSPYTSFCADDSTDVYGFIQLDVLNISSMGIDIADPNKKEWKEISRWIKYEQDLEEGADKLGKAHIAPLAFHFIMRLNYIIEKNAIALLDLDEKDMSGIGSRITEVLLATGLIKPEEVSQLMSDLLLRHKLAPDRDKGSFVAKLATTMTESLFDENSKSIEASPTLGSERRNSTKPKNVLAKLAFSNRSLSFQQKTEAVDIETSAKSPPKFLRSSEDVSQRRRRESIQMVLQPSAEATLIMVRGDYKRKKGVFIYVRLQDAVPLLDITMVPTRNLAIFLAPSGYDDEFVEIGRSFGTLMSNRQFYETVLNASGTKDILSGINEFLHESIVLPPGDWYNHRHLYDLLPQHCLESKSEIIKKQKLKAAKKIGLEHYGESFGEGNIPESFVVERKDSSKSEIIDPLVRTGKPFGGLINDMKRRYSRYPADIIDGLNLQCFAATIFLYFASLAHNITFGGLLGQKTNGYIGVTETLIAACGSGIIFSLLSGQPVVPIAPTAPLLLFDEILYKFLEGYGIEFLPFRVWISFWVLLITVIFTAFEGSVLTRNFTRFTQETFSALISLIFVVEAFSNIFRIYKEHPLGSEYFINPTTSPSLDLLYHNNGSDTIPKDLKIMNQPNTALLSTFLMFGTFIIAYTLKQMRYSTLFPSKVRYILADFSVPIAILIMVIVDNNAGGVYTTKIEVPEKFEPTSVEKRGWIISPLGIDKAFNPWVPVLSILPAFLVFILMSCALLICELIIGQKEKLDKGCGFHLDVLIVALVNVVSAIFGGPFLSCATLKALAHLNALTVYSKNNPPGIPPSVIEVKQERVSGLFMSILIGLSILMAPLLKYVSMSVLFGVFLYMGITSLILTQFYERMILFITPTDQHPPVIYVRKVPTWKIHLFTLVQIGSLVVLWTVKSIKAISLAFPFIIMLLIPIRLNLKYIYTESELDALDSSALKPPPPAEKSEKVN